MDRTPSEDIRATVLADRRSNRLAAEASRTFRSAMPSAQALLPVDHDPVFAFGVRRGIPHDEAVVSVDPWFGPVGDPGRLAPLLELNLAVGRRPCDRQGRCDLGRSGIAGVVAPAPTAV